MIRILKNIWHSFDEYLLYLFVFLLPWQTRWIIHEASLGGIDFEFGRMSLYSFDIILVVLFVSLFIKRWREIKITSREIFNVAILFCVFVLFSIFLASNKGVAIYWSLRVILGMGLFFVLQKINFSKARLAIVSVMAGSIQGIIALWQFSVQGVWENKWLGMSGQTAWNLGPSVVEFGLERWLRAYGSLPHPNVLGGILVFAVIGLVYLILRIHVFKIEKSKRSVKSRELFVLLSGTFIVVGIFYSFSRAAWLGLVLVLVGGLFFVQRHREFWARQFGRITMVYFLAILMFFSIGNLDIVKTRLQIGGQERLEQMSLEERKRNISEGWEIVKENWFVGLGIGNYAFEVVGRNPGIKAYNVQPPHNVPLLVWVELGLVGLLILLVLNILILFKLVKQKKWGMIGLLFVMYLLMMFDHYWWTLGTGVYVWWLVLGISLRSVEYN